MNVDIKTIFAVVSAVGVFGAVLAWWLGRFLEDRVDAKEAKIEIKHLKEQLDEMKADITVIEHRLNHFKTG